nr:plasma membrane-associated cation-binding protein 1 [Ipomoea batatas]
MNYWKAKVLPKIKKVFEKNGTKKAAAAEACKAFDDSKEQYGKEFEDNKTELQPKVVEVYEACSAEIKGLVKEPKDSGLKKHSADVQKLLDELVKIEVEVKAEEIAAAAAEEEPKAAEAPPAAECAPATETPATAAEPPKAEEKPEPAAEPPKA